jgi:hypothetical protein
VFAKVLAFAGRTALVEAPLFAELMAVGKAPDASSAPGFGKGIAVCRGHVVSGADAVRSGVSDGAGRHEWSGKELRLPQPDCWTHS